MPGGQVLVGCVVLECEPPHSWEQALGTQPAQRGEQRVVPQDVIDHEGSAAGRDGVPDGIRVVEGERNRLLAEHVPARGQRPQRKGRMGVRRRREDHCLDPVIGQQRRLVRGDVDSMVGGGLPRPRRVGVGDRDHRHLRQGCRSRQHESREATSPDDTDAQGPPDGHRVRSSRATPIAESAMP